MLRSKMQAALNELLVAVQESADMYADDAELAHDRDLSALFGELAEQRRQLTDAIAEEVRRRGDLPELPDTDRETLMRLGKRLKASLQADERSALVEDRLEAEAVLEEKTGTVLAQDDSADARGLLERVQQDIDAARRRLEEAREALQG